MTRQEELVQAARKEYPEWEEAQCHFIDGAHYADSHPHWISVEDKLPPMRDEDGLSDKVLTHSKGGGIYFNRYNYGHNTWDNAYVFNVTHWLLLPLPPMKGMNKQKVIDLFEGLEKETQHCRTCKHRKRFLLNEYSNKVVQCCDLQPSNRSNSGYKTIKVTDIACGFYEPKKGGEE